MSWDQADMVAEEARRNRHTGAGIAHGSMNSKQMETDMSMHHIHTPIEEIQDNIRTYITHNMGGRWELIKAPEISYGGKRTACYIEDGCSLHLELYSNGHEFNPVHST